MRVNEAVDLLNKFTGHGTFSVNGNGIAWSMEVSLMDSDGLAMEKARAAKQLVYSKLSNHVVTSEIGRGEKWVYFYIVARNDLW